MWYLMLVIFFLFLPNFSLAKSDYIPLFISQNSGSVSIQEVKAKGISAPSHYGEWLEIMNTSQESVELGNFCFVNDWEYIVEVQSGTKEPKNCFPSVQLKPKEVVIIAYSASWFLRDNGFSIEQIEAKLKAGDDLSSILGGYLFELKETGDFPFVDKAVPNLENISLSRFYLADNKGSIYMFDQKGILVDSFVWQKADPDTSWQNPAYDQDLAFVSFAPTPFSVLPEFIEIDLQVDFEEVNIFFQRRGGPVPYEKVSIYKDNELVAFQDFVGLEKISFSGLEEDTNYELLVQVCDDSFCFQQTMPFRTKQHYPLLWLNEIYPAPAEGEKEFVEIYNPNIFTVDLSGWSIQDKTGRSCDLSGQIKADGFLVFYPCFVLNNDTEEVILLNPQGDESDRVIYSDALVSFSYSRFGLEWEWSRQVTSGKKNIFKSKFLSCSVEEARQMDDWVEVKAKVIIPSGVFASSYFYIAQAGWGLKVENSQKYDFPFGSCLLWQGKIKQGQEPYLQLSHFEPAKGCVSFQFFKTDPGKLSLGQLVVLEGKINSEKGGYFLDNSNLKLRSPFKLRKSKALVKGVVGLGSKYQQLFVYLPEWVNYLSAPDTVENKSQVLALSSTNKKEKTQKHDAKDIPAQTPKSQVAGVSLDFGDFRQNNSDPEPFSYVLLFPYYLTLLLFLRLAKRLFFP